MILGWTWDDFWMILEVIPTSITKTRSHPSQTPPPPSDRNHYPRKKTLPMRVQFRWCHIVWFSITSAACISSIYFPRYLLKWLLAHLFECTAPWSFEHHFTIFIAVLNFNVGFLWNFFQVVNFKASNVIATNNTGCSTPQSATHAFTGMDNNFNF